MRPSPPFAGDPNKFLAGVFDGHGHTGDLCALFVRDQIAETLAKLSARYPNDFDQAFKMAFLQINQRLEKNQDIDASLSGTTACAAFFEGTTLKVANIGDSRAVLGVVRGAGGLDWRVEAYPLSTDQTPYRKDERLRIREAGGLVMSHEQLIGQATIDEEVCGIECLVTRKCILSVHCNMPLSSLTPLLCACVLLAPTGMG